MRKLSEKAKENARIRANAWYAKYKKRPARAKQTPEMRAAYHKGWVDANKEKNAAYKTKYRDNNRDRVRQSAREYVARRREKDDNFKIRFQLRSRIWSALKKSGARKSATTVALTGCSLEFLRGYLEARFKEGMTWKNYGKWHVDHRVPCAEFDLRDPIQQKQCFNFSNLQPLWGPDNLRKSAKRPPTYQAELI